MQINSSMLKELKKFMRGLISSSFAKEFRKPVDVIGLGLTDYDLIITCPMDLGTMKNKLQQNQYLTLEEFKEDFELLCKNCYTYNTNHNDYVPQQCRLLENAFNKYILTFEERVKKGEFEKKRRTQQDKSQKKEKAPKVDKPKPEENMLRIAIYPPTNKESIQQAAGSNYISLNIPNYIPPRLEEQKRDQYEQEKKEPEERKAEITAERPSIPIQGDEDQVKEKILKAIGKLEKREFFATYPSINKEQIIKAVIEGTQTPSEIFKDIIVKMCTDDADIEVIEQFHNFWCSKVQVERPTEEILEEFNQLSSIQSQQKEDSFEAPEPNTKISLNIRGLSEPEEKKSSDLQKEANKIVLKLDQIEPVQQEDEEEQEEEDDQEDESNSQQFIESQENQNTKIAIKVEDAQSVAPDSLKVQIPLPPPPAPKIQLIPTPNIAPVPIIQMVSQYGTQLHPAQNAPNITKTPQTQLNEYLQRMYVNFRNQRKLLKIRKSQFVNLPPGKWKRAEESEVSQPYSLVQFYLSDSMEELEK